MQVDSSAIHQFDQLLQLPAPPLNGVLQKLDHDSLVSSALACSKLSQAAPVSITQVAARCNTQKKLDSFKLWLQQHDNKITKCSIEDAGHSVWHSEPHLRFDECLPCPDLRQLNLMFLKLQLEPAGDCPGLLHDCTGLQELYMRGCAVKDTQAAFAAIAALPELRSLCVVGANGFRDMSALEAPIFGDLQLLTHLTKLQLDVERLQQPQQLGQLSVMTNLEELVLKMPSAGVPNGLPSQLQKLTCLDVSYSLPVQCDTAEQFQHLSSLTALQDLKVDGRMGMSAGLEAFFDQVEDLMLGPGAFASGFTTSHLAGTQHVHQLTSLELNCTGLDFNADSTRSWANRLTALQKLSLSQGDVQADAIAAFTQLRALSIWELQRHTPLDGLLLAVSGLAELTELSIKIDHVEVPPSTAAACTALTVGTNLCILQLGVDISPSTAPAGFDMLTAGALYPNLRAVDLSYGGDQPFLGKRMPVSGRQLKQLCSCCPAIESLAFAISRKFPPAAFSSLLQLSALTSLWISDLHAATAAAVGVAAQLTGLKQLTMAGLSELTDPRLLQLTALTTLEELEFVHAKRPMFDTSYLGWKNKARHYNPPNVWLQLQQHFKGIDGAARPPAPPEHSSTGAAESDSELVTDAA